MRSLTISSRAGTMNLDGSEGVRAKLAVRGTGLAPVSLQWAEGAGSGRTYRGGRTLGRTFDLPVKVSADRINPYNRDLVRRRAAKIGQILAIPNAPVRVTLDLDAGSEKGDRWWCDMVRSGGGDWDWSSDTDGQSFLKQVFTLESGSPYWTSLDQDGKVIEPKGVGLGILGPGVSLAQLRVGSTSGFGETTINNTGDIEAYPTWTFKAPFSGFTMVSEYGQVLTWIGVVPKSLGYIVVNTADGTVTDETGANRFAELATAPQFWSVRPGITAANVVMTNAGTGAKADVVWNVQRELLF